MQTDPFSDLYREFHPRILRYLDRLVGPDDANDMTQEVFFRVYKGYDSFEGRSSLATWIYRIASNVAIDSYRNASFRNRRGESPLPIPDELSALASLFGQTPRAPVDNDMLNCVREFINSLPENYRAPFVLHELEGYSNAEVAEILGVSITTAKIRIHRGKVRLKKKMENGCCLFYDEENRLACSRKTET